MKYRALAWILVIALLTAPVAQASKALGWELVKTDTVLGPGVTLTTQTLWGDSKQDYRREQYVTYLPGQGSEPVVCYGATLTATGALTTMARGLESYGRRVLAGANGDYFVMATGVPLGMVVSYGVLRSSSSYHYAVGFRADGSAFVGKPEMTIYSDFLGYHLAVSGGYNKTREGQSGSYLFSGDIGGATKGKGEGINVVLRPVTVPEDYAAPAKPQLTGEAEEDQALTAGWQADLLASTAGFETRPAQLSIGGTLRCVVESASVSNGPVDIPEGRLVLTIPTDNHEYLVNAYARLIPGDLVKLSVTTPDPCWNEAVSAIGAYEYILKNGEMAGDLGESAGPRTALGIKADGAVILYTLDGRQPGHSVGGSVRQVAQRLQELGCVEAVLFDGGGSTTFGTTGALDSGFSLLNRPSDGSQRAVTNALFFLSQTEPTGELGSLYVQPQSALMLSGAKQSLTSKGIDTGFYPLGGGEISGVTYTVEGPGEMSGDVFVAGGERGVATVTATAANGAEGKAQMTVIATPDAIAVSNVADGKEITALNLDPGQRVSMDASATWYQLPLLADDGCFTWSVSPEVGTVDPWGNLTAGTKAGAGTLTVSAGGRAVSISVTVGGHVNTLEPCEGELFDLFGEDAEISLSNQQVHCGTQSLRVDYPTDRTSAVVCDLPVEPGESRFGCWAWGDGSGLKLEAELRLDDGQAKTVTLTTGGFTGWKQLQTDIPENTATIERIRITPAQGSKGVLYLDQFISANGPILDTTGPTVDLKVREGAVTATLSDNVDKIFHWENVSLTLDGREVEFVLSGNRVNAWVDVFDGQDHRLTITVGDASGNRSRTSLDLPGWGRTELPFADVESHWAKAQITYLYDQGVTNGREVEGKRYFDPQTDITRAEFATMLARWLRADLTGYSASGLPFADAGSIPAWAAGAVGYLYDMGIMTGSLEKGKLYAQANAPISRAQAMTMLGRIQGKGYESYRGTFADDGDIPAWASEHIYSLAGQGVVSGYHGSVRPQASIARCEVAKLLATMW